MSRPIVGVLCFCLAPAVLCAQDDQPRGTWPHLRGPAYDGTTSDSRTTGLLELMR